MEQRCCFVLEQALQVAPRTREALQLEQSLLHAAAGDLEHAYDVAEQLSASHAGTAVCGLIRHAQWAAAVRSAAGQRAEPNGVRSGLLTAAIVGNTGGSRRRADKIVHMHGRQMQHQCRAGSRGITSASLDQWD